MAEISASGVKELREKTGAGMMDCKKALTETDGDIEKAIDWLRKKGLATAAKKAGRVASQGLVGVKAEGTSGVVLEVNAETDFVSRNDQFQKFVTDATAVSLKNGGDIDKTKTASMAGKTVEQTLTDLIAKIGENMAMRRSAGISVSKGAVASYVHSAVVDGLGKIGVLVGLESEAPAEKLLEFGKQVAMHVAAANPVSLTIEAIPPAVLQREKDILSEQAKASGKPANVIEKMMEGRLRKYYEESVLLEQFFVMDPDKKIKALLEEKGKELGKPVKLTGFVRYALGDGIEKKEDDFAAEVAKAAKG